MSLDLEVTSQTVPEGLDCIVSNERWQELVMLLRVMLPDGFKWNIGNTVPAPEDRIWPWLRLDGDGRPDGVYYYVGGSWLSKHESAPGTVIMWEGLEANIDAFDGGETAAITPTTGPFWEKVDEMDGRIPVGPGELDAGPPAINVAINEDKGAYEVQLTSANIQRHRHHVLARQTVSGGSLPTGSNQVADDGGGNAQENYIMQGTGTAATRGRTSFVEDGSQDDPNEPFPILPQVRGIWFLRRTARTHHRI